MRIKLCICLSVCLLLTMLLTGCGSKDETPLAPQMDTAETAEKLEAAIQQPEENRPDATQEPEENVSDETQQAQSPLDIPEAQEEAVEIPTVESKQLPDGPCFVISDASGQAGEEISVTVSMENNPGIIAAGLWIAYDSNRLELIRVEDSGLLNEPTFSDSCSKNPYFVSWNDALAPENTYDNGVLATMTFKIKEDCPSGASLLDLTYRSGDVFDWDLKDVTFQTVAGTITVTG